MKLVTNDERRRIAYELTVMGAHYNAFYQSGYDDELRLTDLLYMTDLMRTVGADRIENLCQRLAELIRPDDDFEAISQGVDREKLLALANEICEWRTWSCTAQIDYMKHVARRIREACGVTGDE